MRVMELKAVVSSAVEAALGAGAEAAEAYAEDSTKREVRVFGGEVESLTDAGERGVGVRAWIGGPLAPDLAASPATTRRRGTERSDAA